MFLVVVDDSPERAVALKYACLRARKGGGRVALLRVIEPAEQTEWAGVGALMQEEGREEAERLLSGLAAQVNEITGGLPILLIREGDPRDELLALIAEDPRISILVLAAAAGGEQPGAADRGAHRPLRRPRHDAPDDRARRHGRRGAGPGHLSRPGPVAPRPEGDHIGRESPTGTDAMFIETESTPNPATLKFLPGREVMGDRGTADFASAEAAARSPLAARIFALPGVARVFLGADFVTVTQAGDADWQALRPQVLGAVMDHFMSGLPVLEGAGRRRRRRGRARTISTPPMPRSSTRSRTCSTPASARRWPATAATSCSAASATAWCGCTSRAPARAAPPPAPP